MFNKRYTIIRYDGESWINQDLISIIYNFENKFLTDFGTDFDKVCCTSFSYKDYHLVHGDLDSVLRTFVKCRYIILNQKGNIIDPVMVFNTFVSQFSIDFSKVFKSRRFYFYGGSTQRKAQKWSHYKRNIRLHNLQKAVNSIIEDEPEVRRKNKEVTKLNLKYSPFRRQTHFSKSWKDQSKRSKQYKQ